MASCSRNTVLNSDRIWIARPPAPGHAHGPGLLLDRDGVLVEERDFLSRPEDVVLAPGAIDLLRWTKEQAIPVAVVSNQSGIDRGMFGWPEYAAVEAEINRQLAGAGVGLDLVIAAPFHPDFTANYGPAQAQWRKPGAAMLAEAGKLLRLDLSASWMVGDKDSDIEAASAAGLKGAVHVLTGHGAGHRAKVATHENAGFCVLTAQDLVQALSLLTARFQAP